MTTISAKVIADSVNSNGKRITTLELRYPRFVHAEFMTHRQFSRNASSSRAIPVARMIEDIIRDPAMPLHWGRNEKGMQARDTWDAEVTYYDTSGVFDTEGEVTRTIYKMTGSASMAWERAMQNAIEIARAFNEAGYHKQVVNRLLEPFMHINVVVTATEWSNFFALRIHKDAEPHIRMLAEAIKDAMDKSVPAILGPGMWHLPYVSPDEFNIEEGVKCSVARCARVSYLTHDGKAPTLEEDLALFQRLVGSHPLHASPAEHQAYPDPHGKRMGKWGNFKEWVQFRKTLAGECQ